MLHQSTEPDGLRRVVLDAGRGNALGPDLLARLEEAFDPRVHVPGPVVLTGRGRSFCTGLDLVAAAAFDRGQMGDLMDAFHRALRSVLLWPGPVVAALQGNALAGGALLALCADERLLAHGPGRFGIHGVQLGVVYPQIAVEVARWRLGRRPAEDLLYGGALRPGHQALAEGLVDGLVDAAVLDLRSAERARAADPVAAKPLLLRPVATRVASIEPAGREAWLDQWFEPATRARVQAARDALAERRGMRPGDPAP